MAHVEGVDDAVLLLAVAAALAALAAYAVARAVRGGPDPWAAAAAAAAGGAEGNALLPEVFVDIGLIIVLIGCDTSLM
jgi:hypothetical protein